MRCLALFTGGLDSLLSVRLVQSQGIEVIGLYVVTPLWSGAPAAAQTRAEALGIELRTVDLAREYCQLLRAPRFGRLEGAAPCLDCRIAMLAKVRGIMAECGASFVISGEVVGQRPKTAARDLEVVAHHSRLGELLLRPLSARLLPPTAPENCGWVDRTRLLAIQGKSRKTQLQYARELGIANVPPPRPDCPLLASPLNTRVPEVLADAADPTPWLLALLPIGRHQRVDAHTRIVVARNRAESEALTAAAQAAEAGQCLLAIPFGFSGPTALVIGPATPAACEQAAALVMQHGRCTGSALELVDFECPNYGHEKHENARKAMPLSCDACFS